MSIRFRLTIWLFVVILLANVLLSVVTVLRVADAQIQEVQTRVRLDLNAARDLYHFGIESKAQYLRGASQSDAIALALNSGDRGRIASLLQPLYRSGQMEVLVATDPSGKVLYRARNPFSHGDDVSGFPIIAQALESGETARGTIIVPREVLLLEGEDLAERAYFEVRPTPAARPTEEKVRTAGMMIGAAVPVFDSEGELAGLLFGGDVLNRSYETVDLIRRDVFLQQTYKGKQVGTATIFQGDLRIATNVMDAEGKRAIGTRLSEEVYERVFEEGEIYAGRAFVVDQWYITAYEPIRNPDGKVIGALYVGILEEAVTKSQRVILSVFLPFVGIITLGSLILLGFITQHILAPIHNVVEMSDRVVKGDLSARTGIRPPGEMGHLCEAIDAMADAVADREERLKQATREQLGQSEKLASIGRLAAGVAHEMNNPLTGVLTFSSLLRERPNLEEQDRQDLDVIVRETTRVREIVRNLLDFARESPSHKTSLDINEVIGNTLRLVRSQKEFRNITIEENLAEGIPAILGDKNQLQQVLLNLSMNACEAMENGGTLTIKTRVEEKSLAIRVSDTGHGIPAGKIDHIFDPFFTTKPLGKGTGLGLSVTYGIVQSHHGSIDVESEEGGGTTFTVRLPLANGRKDED